VSSWLPGYFVSKRNIRAEPQKEIVRKCIFRLPWTPPSFLEAHARLPRIPYLNLDKVLFRSHKHANAISFPFKCPGRARSLSQRHRDGLPFSHPCPRANGLRSLTHAREPTAFRSLTRPSVLSPMPPAALGGAGYLVTGSLVTS